MSSEWKDGESGKTVSWPLGLAGKGNEGVAGLVKQNPASIAYAQLAYGIEKSLQYGSVENREASLSPPPVAVTAAAENVLNEVPEDLRFSITIQTPDERGIPDQ